MHSHPWKWRRGWMPFVAPVIASLAPEFDLLVFVLHCILHQEQTLRINWVQIPWEKSLFLWLSRLEKCSWKKSFSTWNRWVLHETFHLRRRICVLSDAWYMKIDTLSLWNKKSLFLVHLTSNADPSNWLIRVKWSGYLTLSNESKLHSKASFTF
jgi:hypothetical protein